MAGNEAHAEPEASEPSHAAEQRSGDRADIADDAVLGGGVTVWGHSQIREAANIGAQTVIGRGVYIDHDVIVGERCKIQNAAQLFYPARLGDGVFVGPGAILTNDRYPRAVSPDDQLKDAASWQPLGVTIADGASIGAGAIILGGVSIEQWAVVGAGAVVTVDVLPFALVVGTPARRIGWVGRSGLRLVPGGDSQFVDTDTGDRFVETSGRLEIAT